MGLFAIGSKDIGIDLGTSNIIVTIKGKGIVLREPSVVAIDRRTDEIVATGKEAKEMLGRTPESIKAVKPLKGGVIADFTATKLMLKNIFKKLSSKYNIKKPRVVVGVPSGITEVEERAVEDTIMQAGAREVYLIEEPLAAAIGSGMHIEEANGSIIVDIGGGTTEVAVICLGGIVVYNSLRVAGDELDEDIVNYMKKRENLSIGITTAEEIKKQIGCATTPIAAEKMEIRGRDLATGLPKNVIIDSYQVLEAMQESLNRIINTVKATLEKTPPELAADLAERGIVLSGGGALIRDLDQILASSTDMSVYITEEPIDAVARGAGKTLEELDRIKAKLINSRRRR